MKPSTLNTAVGVLFAVVGTVPGAAAAGINRVGRMEHGDHHHEARSVIATGSVITVTETTRSGCALKVVTRTTTTDMTITVTPGLSTDSTSSIAVTPFLTTTSPSAVTTAVTIDTTLTPGSVATTTERMTVTVTPTTTVGGDSGPTGKPSPGAIHCGVHGLPVGDFFLGQYVEDSADVPVTLEGCYEFCSTAWGATNGCESYDFYTNSLGAPRCDLYGSPVAYALDTVDNNEPNLWFDLACGNPERWVDASSNNTVVVRSVRDRSRRI